jgi:hypothetical protein
MGMITKRWDACRTPPALQRFTTNYFLTGAHSLPWSHAAFRAMCSAIRSRCSCAREDIADDINAPKLTVDGTFLFMICFHLGDPSEI